MAAGLTLFTFTDGLSYKGDTSTHAQGTDPSHTGNLSVMLV